MPPAKKEAGYFGVPLQNYFAWILTTFVVYVGAGLLWKRQRAGNNGDRALASLPVAVYALYAVSYMVPKPIPELQVVAVFAMGMPALLACVLTWLGEAKEVEEPEPVQVPRPRDLPPLAQG